MSGADAMRLACLQFQVTPGAPDANLETVGRLSEEVPRGSLAVLPELWSTGFSPRHCREQAGRTPELVQALKELAAGREICFAGSLAEKDPDRPDRLWNTLFVVDSSGVAGRYRKQHLFRFWQEDAVFAAGERPAPIRTGRGLIGPLICYDLRFPELARSHCFHGAQLLVVSALWPASRIEHWQILLRARAIENQVPLVACNSCGDGAEGASGGHSMIVAPDGETLASGKTGEGIVQATVPRHEREAAREKFCSVGERPWLHADADKVVGEEQLLQLLAGIRRQGSKVAFTNGCFDLLHPGHVSYLEQARATADLLVVGLNSDRSVRAIKGPSRPINRQEHRARVLAALGCVDYVVIFDEKTPLRLIRAIGPDILVKGADWPEEEIVGAAEVKAAGGRVERITFTFDCSTSQLVHHIQQQNTRST